MATATTSSASPSKGDYGLRGAFIGISGLIGAGKSTLAEALATELGLPAYYEDVSGNSYLEDFYKDQARFAFPLQVFLLNLRFAMQQRIIWTGGGVQDRTIYEDAVFAKMLRDSGIMSPRDYQTYLDLFENMSRFMRSPTLIVYLDVKPEESLRRIALRGREMEKGISLEYLTLLHCAYEDFVAQISKVIPVIRVDYSRFRTAQEMAKVISEQYRAMQMVKSVAFEP